MAFAEPLGADALAGKPQGRSATRNPWVSSFLVVSRKAEVASLGPDVPPSADNVGPRDPFAGPRGSIALPRLSNVPARSREAQASIAFAASRIVDLASKDR